MSIGGGGLPTTPVNVTFAYVNGNDPRGDGGLGIRSTITYVDVYLSDPATNTTAETAGTKYLLQNAGDIGPVNLNTLALNDPPMWLRAYVGVVSGDPAADPPDPTGALPFTAADPADAYTGTLNINFL